MKQARGNHNIMGGKVEKSDHDNAGTRDTNMLFVNDAPTLPKADKRGRVPAIEYTRASIARDIIKQRKALGLSQQALADLAGLRQETLSRLESGKHTATVRTIDKIDKSLQKMRMRHR